MSSGSVIHITDDTFETEVLQSRNPVLVDFWAEWCGPCRAIAPVLEEIAGEYAGQLKVVKLDVDAIIQTTTRYGVLGIPTLILFKEGQPVARLVGVLPKEELQSLIRSHLSDDSDQEGLYQEFVGG